MFEITKEFKFDAGHRVYTQKLNETLALDTKHPCRRLHGHEFKVKVSLTAKELHNGMVTDFKHLAFFKKFLDDFIDHRFIFSINDPILPKFISMLEDVNTFALVTIGVKKIDFVISGYRPTLVDEIRKALNLYHFVLVQLNEEDALSEMLSSLVIIKDVPTAENLCKLFCVYIQEFFDEKYNQNIDDIYKVKVSKIELFETSKSLAIFKPGG